MSVNIRMTDSDALKLSAVLARVVKGEIAVDERTEEICLNVIDIISGKFPVDDNIESYVDVTEFDMCFANK